MLSTPLVAGSIEVNRDMCEGSVHGACARQLAKTRARWAKRSRLGLVGLP